MLYTTTLETEIERMLLRTPPEKKEKARKALFKALLPLHLIRAFEDEDWIEDKQKAGGAMS
jgi:hypothetical protein